MSERRYEEWRVTGDPGHGYPPYEFTWSTWTDPDRDPGQAARAFISEVADHKGGWVDGPHLSRRTVTVTEWEPVAR